MPTLVYETADRFFLRHPVYATAPVKYAGLGNTLEDQYLE